MAEQEIIDMAKEEDCVNGEVATLLYWSDKNKLYDFLKSKKREYLFDFVKRNWKFIEYEINNNSYSDEQLVNLIISKMDSDVLVWRLQMR